MLKNYLKTVGMNIIEGNNFSDGNDTLSVVFNEAAINRLRLKNPISQIIKCDNYSFKIVGVVKNAFMISPFFPADPTMFFMNPGAQHVLLYQLSPKIKTHDAIDKLTDIFNKYNPGFPFS